MKRTTILTAAALAVGLLGAGFGTAEAVTSIPPGTIHGCVAGSSRTLEHVYTNPSSGTSCPSGESQVIWSKQGPAGPQGPAGAAGAQGPAGVAGPAGPSTAGPSGLDDTYEYGTGLGEAIAYCPTDHPYVLGGGFDDEGSPGQTPPEVWRSQPVNPTSPGSSGWEVIITDAQSQVTAYVLCAK
jgi:hypothetical protein